jgi:pimeloyl-ACP methyl ester carboxylesterase
MSFPGVRRRPFSARALGVVLALALSAVGTTSCGGRDEQDASSAQAKPYAVWGAPTGRFAGRPPTGVVMLIHGGGWAGINLRDFRGAQSFSPALQALGYETMTIDYRFGVEGLRDADAFYRQARARFGARMPICAVGMSAGGHIALMLAVKHPDMACAISLAGPTDLTRIGREPGGRLVQELAVRAFGRGRLAEFSPVLRARTIRARVLLVAAANDPLVPLAQQQRMARALPGAQTIVLPGDDRGIPFVHSRVSPAASAAAARDQARFLAESMRAARADAQA